MKSHVILSRDQAAGLGRRVRVLERLARELHEQLGDERDLLNTALVELAHERGARDVLHFRRRWIRQHRDLTTSGLSISHSRRGVEA